MKPPIFTVLRRIGRLSPIHQRDHLRALIEAEPPRSIRRGELEAALKSVMLRQLRKESRQGKAA
jgi:hypothetical protein